jgi:hypothetical protein
LTAFRIFALALACFQAALGVLAVLAAGVYLAVWLGHWLFGVLVLVFGVPTAYAQFLVFNHVLEQEATDPWQRVARLEALVRARPTRAVYCPHCRQRHKVTDGQDDLRVRCVACHQEFTSNAGGPENP